MFESILSMFLRVNVLNAHPDPPPLVVGLATHELPPVSLIYIFSTKLLQIEKNSIFNEVQINFHSHNQCQCKEPELSSISSVSFFFNTCVETEAVHSIKHLAIQFFSPFHGYTYLNKYWTAIKNTSVVK